MLRSQKEIFKTFLRRSKEKQMIQHLKDDYLNKKYSKYGHLGSMYTSPLKDGEL